MLAIAVLMAMIFHPGDKHETYFFTQQMFVSFTMFTEALSLAPQMYHMKTHHSVEGLTTSYLIVLGVSRLSRVYFWYTMGGSRVSKFWYLIAADVIHTCMTCVFAWRFRLVQRTYGGESVLVFHKPSSGKDN